MESLLMSNYLAGFEKEEEALQLVFHERDFSLAVIDKKITYLYSQNDNVYYSCVDTQIPAISRLNNKYMRRAGNGK